MKRTDLIKLIFNRCRSYNYGFQHGFLYRMNAGIEKYPLFWLCPLVLTETKINGLESYKTYEGEAYIHELNNKFNEYQKEEIWQKNEDFAIRLLKLLPDNSDVVAVTEIKCEPDEFQFKDGTISTKITFAIQLYDCTE